MTAMVVRPRRREDLPALAEALREQQPISRYPVRDPLPMPVEDFLRADDALGAWTAELDGRPVGQICWVGPGDDTDGVNRACAELHGCAVGDLAWVSAFFVGLPARRTGVGRRLLATAVADMAARGRRPCLEVLALHPAARRLYDATGWREVVRTRPDWLREAVGEDGPDVVVMGLVTP